MERRTDGPTDRRTKQQRSKWHQCAPERVKGYARRLATVRQKQRGFFSSGPEMGTSREEYPFLCFSASDSRYHVFCPKTKARKGFYNSFHFCFFFSLCLTARSCVCLRLFLFLSLHLSACLSVGLSVPRKIIVCLSMSGCLLVYV